jgi:serine phosphatase RsbU (regulator of sigma subunit)
VNGAFVLRDLGSRFGTFVNGQPITETPLGHGDRITLGHANSIELVFLSEGDDVSALGHVDGSGVTDLRQMAALLDGLRALGSGRVVEEVLTLVLDLAIEVTGAERGFVMLADAAENLEFKIARMKGRVSLSGRTFETSRKIPEEVFRSGQSRVVGDLMDDSDAAVHLGTIQLGIRHVLCAPLRIVHFAAAPRGGPEQRVIGVLYLDGRERANLLSRTTQSALETFATEAAMAIESARLYSEAAEKTRIDHELSIAAEIQRALLPEPTYAGATFDLAGQWIPCRTVGGDFFDYLELSDGRVACALSDVSGKGPPAALLATAVQSQFAAHASVAPDPSVALARINQGLLRRAIHARFATMFYGVLSPGGELCYCSAGHEPPLLIGRSGIRSLEARGFVLGLFGHATYESETVRLEPDDLLVVCSDGVTEARNAADEEFGRERLVACVSGAHGQEADVLAQRVMVAVREFVGAAAQADDITVLVVRHRGVQISP